MNPETVLPRDFDGVFRFTNWTEKEFTARWGGIEYTFPPLKQTPIIISNATPLEIQNIRKKFAKELAEREIMNTDRIKEMNEKNKTAGRVQSALTYAPGDLEPFVQRCLEPLPVGKAETKKVVKEEFKPIATKVLKSKLSGDLDEDSLVGGGQVIA